MKTIYQLYIENKHRAGFVVRHIAWSSGFATVHSVDGRTRGYLPVNNSDKMHVIATIVDAGGVRKEELPSADESVWEKLERSY
ncbi:TPA: hypothetical protein R4X16_004377 [Klebsiella variicola subsp. variicola]|uniref:hypothetical protein n=1 Tax=Klebsiella TaxID=570 RepID=UPI001660391C|nr:hypothetical protein [Klebsiella variicola]MBD0721939.1 hypothetical protein [Klebsiella variicola]HED1713359.1 hypothetical protein [Klebsiella variicola subsp. variicola]